ncbi:MAG: class B sortase [Clostridia bacterium]|nr:class B sortase [Clostridia bacterium]
MKNIYEDGTLPGSPEIFPEKKPNPTPPTRPKKQVTPTPMQQENLQRQRSQPQPQQPPTPYGAMPVYGMPAYPYVQVGADANGQPIYAPAPQVQYTQGVPVYPYTPYMPQPMQPPQVPEQPAAANGEPDPGTRVLYQSPDFDLSDSASKNTEVGAHFAQGNFRQEPVISHEDIEVEEVSLTSDSSLPIVPANESIEIDEVDFDPSEIDALIKEKETTFAEEDTASEAPSKRKKQKKDVPLSKADKKAAKKTALSKKEIIRRVVLVISIILIIVSVGMLINEFRLAKQNENVEEKASNLIIEEATTTKAEDKNDEDENDTTEVQLTPEQQWAQIKQEYPSVIFPANIQLKYAKLYAENQDFVGYLSADAVNLNLPVVQANDDEEYLKKNFYGQTTKYGCPFVTHLNNIDPLDMNTVIFGHHMNNNTIFGTLDAYKKIDGFKKAPVITFNTLYRDYSWKIIAAFITNAYGKDDINNYVFPYYFTSLSSYERYAAYLNELSQRSLYDTGVDVVPTDKILTLSTCSHEFEDARFVVVARLVRPGESTGVDTSKAVVNSSPRYPQAYYDAKKIKTNPYKNASQWQVG